MPDPATDPFTGPIAPEDADACAREPIRVPGAIQPHGVLLVLSDAGHVLQVSENSLELLDIAPADLLGRSLADAGLAELDGLLARDVPALRDGAPPVHLGGYESPDGRQRFSVLSHRTPAGRIVELERTTDATAPTLRDLYPLVGGYVTALQPCDSVAELAGVAAREIRRLTGVDRVLVYRFEPDWHGVVVAEDKSDALPSFLDLRFPASDIPAQARELYRINPARQIVNADYTPVAIRPAVSPITGAALDLRFAALRSVSPVHLQYMKNMGTAASMSFSILQGQRLWGLISCHHATPRFTPVDVRSTCELMAQVLAPQLIAVETAAESRQRERLRGVLVRLLASMAAHGNFLQGLIDRETELLDYASADGAALLADGQITLLGKTPDAQQVRQLVTWLEGQKDFGDVYHSSSIAGVLTEARAYRHVASGVMLIALSKLHTSYLLLFRPEVVRTVKWGGNPTRPTSDPIENGRLRPRRSFEQWKQTVQLQSLPWSAVEIEAAGELRNAMIGIVLRKAEELADLSAELARSNNELEAFSFSVSHDLRAPLRHIAGYLELIRETEPGKLSQRGDRYLNTAMDAARYAGTLVDNLLHFSQMARSGLNRMRVNFDQMLDETRRDMALDVAGRTIQWHFGHLGEINGDPNMLRLVLRNLLSNAVKYTRDRTPAVVTVTRRDERGEAIFSVVDNGVGFDMCYVDKLFGVFQRLHRMEEFEGTGIGLANVRRIINRHGGRTWATGELGVGATFFFSLPQRD